MQITNHDVIGMVLSDGSCVDAERLQTGLGGLLELRSNVAQRQALDRLPLQIDLLGDVLDGVGAVAPTEVEGESLGVQRVLQQEGQTFALYVAGPTADHSADLQMQVNSVWTAGRIPTRLPRVLVPGLVNPSACTAGGFLPGNQHDELRTRITEETLHRGAWSTAAKRVFIGETRRFMGFRHAAVMPNVVPPFRGI